MKRRFLGLTLVIFLSFGCDASDSRSTKSGKAPDFKLALLSNSEQTVQLSKVSAAKPVLLAFWATWCPSCIEEIPILNKWHDQYVLTGKLEILGINVEESPKHIRGFLEDHPVSFPVLLDQDGRVAESFGLAGLPVTVFLAKGGEILYYGFSLPPNLDQLMENL